MHVLRTRDEFTVEKKQLLSLSSRKYLSDLELTLFIIKYSLWVTNSISKLPIKTVTNSHLRSRKSTEAQKLIAATNVIYVEILHFDIHIVIYVKPHAV